MTTVSQLDSIDDNLAMATARHEAQIGQISVSQRRWLRRRALEWFSHSGRTFPWRAASDPYHVLIAELLLQRTRADLVEPIYHTFLDVYPDVAALAQADEADVVALLRPLGFLHRSARLPALARALMERHEGAVPSTKEELLALPGVGEYVANAVLAIAFDERRPLLDPNVIRVVGRVFGRRSVRARARDDRQLWQEIAALLPRRSPTQFALALVDLGAILCRPRRPRCHECPLRLKCKAFLSGDVSPAHL
jgi:A/G-specific adenine glycosylase